MTQEVQSMNVRSTAHIRVHGRSLISQGRSFVSQATIILGTLVNLKQRQVAERAGA